MRLASRESAGVWPDVAAVPGLLLAVVAVFWPILSGQAYLWGDFSERVFPLRQYALGELAAGRLPLWAPNLFAGVPFQAMIDNGVLYPPTWLLLPFVDDGALSYLALEVHTLAHLWLMGVAAYLLCRSVSMSRTGALVAGLTWMLSGPVLFRAFHPALLQTLAWMPIVLTCLMRAYDRRDVRWSAAAACAWAMAVLAGHPQGFLYVAYASVVLYGVYLVAALRAGEGRAGAWRLTGMTAFALVVGALLSAPALLPALELATLSERTTVGLTGSMQSVPEYRQLVAFLVPDLFGRMSPARWDYWGPGRTDFGFYWESYVYVGVLPLVLAAVGAGAARGRVRAVFAALAVFALLGILGAVTPFPDVLRAVLPGFEQFRAHSRLAIVWSLCIAVLAGLGADALIRPASEASPARVRTTLTLVSGVALLAISAALLASTALVPWLAGSEEAVPLAAAGLSLYGGRAALLAVASLGVGWLGYARRLRPPVLSAAVVALIVGDLFAAAGGFNQSPAGPGEVFPNAPLVGALRARAAQDGGRLAITATTPRILPMNAGIVYGLETPFDGLASPLLVAATAPPADEEAKWDLMNVTHVLGRGPGGTGYVVDDRPDPMPRAWVARDYVVAPDPGAVAAAMGEPDFDHRATVTLDREPGLGLSPRGGATPERPRVTRPEPTEVDVEVDMTAPGLLVLSELFYPGWTAQVEGMEREVLRADGAIRAVALPEGRHRVRFVYRSRFFALGLWIAVAAAILTAVTGLAPERVWGRLGKTSLT